MEPLKDGYRNQSCIANLFMGKDDFGRHLGSQPHEQMSLSVRWREKTKVGTAHMHRPFRVFTSCLSILVHGNLCETYLTLAP